MMTSHHIHIVQVPKHYECSITFFLNFGQISMMHFMSRQVPLDRLFRLYHQCKNPAIIVRQRDQGTSKVKTLAELVQ